MSNGDYLVVRDSETNLIILRFDFPYIGTNMAGAKEVAYAMACAAIPVVSNWGMRHYEIEHHSEYDYLEGSQDVYLENGVVHFI